ncbi:collagenase-like [Anopheles maculipalpis]|uniref:collagenase-like n=1 Tax=Anopheles maculipalpis TaxID=1496333 RepID=UPI002158A311|nr:collagenase-like [Anopheles maculipalpis]
MVLKISLLVVLMLEGAFAIEQSAINGTDVDWSKVRSIDEFDHYWTRLSPELQLYRNTAPGPASRIANGFQATPGQFPYHVVLLADFTLGTGLCGATVLTNSYILTAAHCVAEYYGIKASGGLAIMGAFDRIIVEPEQQRIPFETAGITIHPQYSYVDVRNDVATVLLTTPMSYTGRIQPTRLPVPSDQRSFARVQGTVMGYGRTSTTSTSFSRFLRYTFNTIISNNECITYWSPIYVDQQNMCLSPANGRSPCIGDSGGALTVSDGLDQLQVGIVSFGEAVGCAVSMPSVYARITYFLPWIVANSDY